MTIIQNFNTIEDILGMCIIGIASLICCYYLWKAHKAIDALYEQNNEAAKMRELQINKNMETILLNIFILIFFFCVLFEWFAAKINTAPSHIDIQVLILKGFISFGLIRSSCSAYEVIKSLTRIRKTDRGLNAPS